MDQLPNNYDGGVLVADGAYASENTVKVAKEHNINLTTTNFTGHKPNDCFAEFKFSKDGRQLLYCANDVAPFHQIYDSNNDRCYARFPLEICTNCPHFEACKPRMLTKYARKEVSWKAVNRAQQLRFMKSEKFKELADFRNGVEAIPSLLRRKYNVDRIPVHGIKATKLFFGFKIGALNFKKLLSFTNSLNQCVPEMAMN